LSDTGAAAAGWEGALREEIVGLKSVRWEQEKVFKLHKTLAQMQY